MSKNALRTSSHDVHPESEKTAYGGVDSYELYMRDIKKYPRIDDEELRQLVGQVQEGKTARKELSSEGLTGIRRRHLADAANRGVEARNRILLANTGLTFAPARKREGHGLDKMDLLQEANIAIIKAAETYDPKRRMFSGHAMLRIRAELADALSEQGRMIRIPNYHSVKLQQMRTIERESENNNEQLTDEVLAEEMHVDADYLNELRTMEWRMHSLNYESDDRDGYATEEGERIADPLAPSVEDMVINEQFADKVRRAVRDSELSLLEKEIVWMRYAEGQTTDTIARYLTDKNISHTPSAVTSIARKALERLRADFEEQGGAEYFEEIE